MENKEPVKYKRLRFTRKEIQRELGITSYKYTKLIKPTTNIRELVLALYPFYK
jgi:hypothetical protein